MSRRVPQWLEPRPIRCNVQAVWRRRHKQGGEGGTGAAVADAPRSEPVADLAQLLAEIDAMSRDNRAARDLQRERRLLRLRHLAGIAVLARNGGSPQFPGRDTERLPQVDGLAETPGPEVTAELLRAGILRDGCLLVRGLVPRA